MSWDDIGTHAHTHTHVLASHDVRTNGGPGHMRTHTRMRAHTHTHAHTLCDARTNGVAGHMHTLMHARAHTHPYRKHIHVHIASTRTCTNQYLTTCVCMSCNIHLIHAHTHIPKQARSGAVAVSCAPPE